MGRAGTPGKMGGRISPLDVGTGITSKKRVITSLSLLVSCVLSLLAGVGGECWNSSTYVGSQPGKQGQLGSADPS